MVSYASHYAVWVLAALGTIGAMAVAVAALRYGRLTGHGARRFLAGEGMALLLGERSLPVADGLLSASLAVARISLLAAAPVALVTGFLTAF